MITSAYRLVLPLALASAPAFADSGATVDAKGALTFRAPRVSSDRTAVVAGKTVIPAGWGFDDATGLPVFEFFPKDAVEPRAKHGAAHITIGVAADNLASKDVADVAKGTLLDVKALGARDGITLKVITARHEVLLARHTHVLIQSYEVTRTSGDGNSYASTGCVAWVDGQTYVLELDGVAPKAEGALVADFEKACTSLSLDTK